MTKSLLNINNEKNTVKRHVKYSKIPLSFSAWVLLGNNISLIRLKSQLDKKMDLEKIIGVAIAYPLHNV